MSPSAAWGRAGLTLAIVLLLDQVTKRLVQDNVAVGHKDAVFPAVELVHVKNDGVAFGAFAGSTLIVGLVTGVALVALVVWFSRHTDRRLAWLPTGLLLGGALGNILDRLRDGAVTDFIKLPKWPAFNVADIAITFGVLALLYVFESDGDQGGAEGDRA